jgi:O-antigen/teichoic acid export membrane protein
MTLLENNVNPSGGRSGAAKALFFTQVLVALLGLPVTVVLARALGPDDYGRYQFLNRVTLVLVAIFCFGLPHAMAWYSSRELPVGQTRSLLRTALWASCLGGIPLSLGALAVGSISEVADFSLWVLMVPFGFFNLVSANLVNYFRGKLDISGIRAVKLTQVITWTLLITAGWLTGLASLALVMVIAVVAQLVSIAVPLIRLGYQGMLFGPAEKIDSRELWRFAFETLPGLALRDLAPYAGQLVVGLVMIPRDLGIYSVALAVVATLGIVTGPINNTVQPFIQRSSSANLVDTSMRSLSASLLVVLLPAVGICITAPFLVPVVFGEPYLSSVGLILIMSVATVLEAISSGMYGILLGTGRPKDSSMSTILSFSIQIVLLLALVPVFGVSGAATASVISSFFAVIVMGRAVARKLQISPMKLLIGAFSLLPSTSAMILKSVLKRGLPN